MWQLREDRLSFLFCQDTLEGASFERGKRDVRYYGGVDRKQSPLSVSVTLCATRVLIIAEEIQLFILNPQTLK